MFAIQWSKEWHALQVELLPDRRGGLDGRTPKAVCMYVTAERLMGRMPMLYIDQDTLGM